MIERKIFTNLQGLATPKQLELLKKLGIYYHSSISKQEASNLITDILAKKKQDNTRMTDNDTYLDEHEDDNIVDPNSGLCPNDLF